MVNFEGTEKIKLPLQRGGFFVSATIMFPWARMEVRHGHSQK